jgi:hypothetical protein
MNSLFKRRGYTGIGSAVGIILFFMLSMCGGGNEPTTEEILSGGSDLDEGKPETEDSTGGLGLEESIEYTFCADCSWAYRIDKEEEIPGSLLKDQFKTQVEYQALTSGLSEEQEAELMANEEFYNGFAQQMLAIKLLEIELLEDGTYPDALLNKIMPLIPTYLRQQLIYQMFVYKLIVPLVDMGDTVIEECYNVHREEFENVPFSEAVEYCKSEILQEKMPKRLEEYLSILKGEQRIIYDADNYIITFLPLDADIGSDDFTIGDDFDLTLEDMDAVDESLFGTTDTSGVEPLGNPDANVSSDDLFTSADEVGGQKEVVMTPDQFQTLFRSHVYLQMIMVGVTDQEEINRALQNEELKRQYLREVLHLILMERRLKEAGILDEDELQALIDRYIPLIKQQLVMNAYMSDYILPNVELSESQINAAVEKVRPMYEAQGYNLATIRNTVENELRSQKAQARLVEHIQQLQKQYTIEQNNAFFQ